MSTSPAGSSPAQDEEPHGAPSRVPPRIPPRIPTRVLIAIAVTMVAWASAFIVIRATSGEFTGGAVALGRLVVGTIVLGIVVLARRRWIRPTRREWLLILGYGIAWFAAYNVTLNLAEHTLDAGTTAMLVNIGPILIALGAGAVLGEGIPRWLAIGAGIAFFGVLLLGFASETSKHVSLAGVLWCLAAAVLYAAGVLFQKPALRRLPAVQVVWMGCVVGAIACLPFAGQLIAGLHAAPAPAILGIVYLGAVPTSIAFSTWAYALSRMPAGQLGVSTYIVPPLTVLMSFLVFGEIPPVLAFVGGVVCLIGVALSRRRPRPVARVTTTAESLAE